MTEGHFAQKTRDCEERIGINFLLVDTYLKKKEIKTRFERPAVLLKTLYSDFVVRELSPLFNNGEPLVLEPPLSAESQNNDVKALKRPRRETNEEPKEEGVSDVGKAITTIGGAHDEAFLGQVQQRFSSILSPEDLTSLIAFLRLGTEKIRLCSLMTKPIRTEVHQAVKDTLGTSYVSSTEDGAVVIEKSTRVTRREALRRSNPLRTRKFLHFTLYKENIDSNRALRAVAKYLGVPLRQLLFSGTKDKRAVTLQRVAVLGLSSSKLSEINNKSFGPECNIKVCSFQEMDVGLRLGDSVGNHFLIALRLLPDGPEFVPDTLRIIQDIIGCVGVINYYGPQRFGTTEVLTSDVGIQLLAGNFEEALRMIFHTKAIIEPNIVPTKEAIERHAYEEALQLLPHYCFQERDMLKHLIQSPNDFLGAFQTMPRTLAMLYCHAVQSLIWNLMASKRMTLGFEPVPGDLVLKSHYEHIQVNGIHRNHSENVNDMAFLLKEHGLPEVTRLTAEDVATGLFSLTDVLLPVPGPDEQLQYPDIDVCSRDAYFTTLASRGAEKLMNAKNPLVKMFHYHGAYRPLVVRPKRLKMRLLNTRGPREPIIPTDLEVLTRGANSSEAADHERVEETATSTLLHKAILVEFSLPPGSYATSVLREFSVCCSEGYHVPTSEG